MGQATGCACVETVWSWLKGLEQTLELLSFLLCSMTVAELMKTLIMGMAHEAQTSLSSVLMMGY
jgi:hypothetical protein